MLTRQGYGQECDWWSVGIILFECLVGYPPFRSYTAADTHKKILRYEAVLPSLIATSCAHLSREACDIIARLLSPASVRLGARGGMAEILSHVWFRGFDWPRIREMVPPVVPRLASEVDTSHFDDVEAIQEAVGGMMCDSWKFVPTRHFCCLAVAHALWWRQPAPKKDEGQRHPVHRLHVPALRLRDPDRGAPKVCTALTQRHAKTNRRENLLQHEVH